MLGLVVTKKNKPLKVCVGASAGGHMTELLGLLKTAGSWPVQPSVYVTTREIWAKKLREHGPTYIVGECDRDKPFGMLMTVFKSVYFIVKERPDVIITTGSLPIAIVCIVSKLIRTKVLWIDSLAQIDELSMSGKLMLKFADVVLVQWPGVADKYPKAEYTGELQ